MPRADHRARSTVQVGANTIFKQDGWPNLLPTVREAVKLCHAIIQEGQWLAILYVLQTIKGHRPLPNLSTGSNNSSWQTMLENCYAAVSIASGVKCQQFNARKNPDLESSRLLYEQSRPPQQARPDRPTWLKPVSLCFMDNSSSKGHYKCVEPTFDTYLYVCTLKNVYDTTRHTQPTWHTAH